MTQYKCENGTLVEYKNELLMSEFYSFQGAVGGNGQMSAQAANEQMVKCLVTKIVTPDGQEHIESLEIIKLFNGFNSRDGIRLIKIFTQIVTPQDDNPKAVLTA